jgi:hypothetical protein
MLIVRTVLILLIPLDTLDVVWLADFFAEADDEHIQPAERRIRQRSFFLGPP